MRFLTYHQKRAKMNQETMYLDIFIEEQVEPGKMRPRRAASLTFNATYPEMAEALAAFAERLVSIERQRVAKAAKELK